MARNGSMINSEISIETHCPYFLGIMFIQNLFKIYNTFLAESIIKQKPKTNFNSHFETVCSNPKYVVHYVNFLNEQ